MHLKCVFSLFTSSISWRKEKALLCGATAYAVFYFQYLAVDIDFHFEHCFFFFFYFFMPKYFIFKSRDVCVCKGKLPISTFPFLFPKLYDFISFSIGGLILDTTVSDPNLVGIVVYTPVINGKN